jgi:hypothetical protein
VKQERNKKEGSFDTALPKLLQTKPTKTREIILSKWINNIPFIIDSSK